MDGHFRSIVWLVVAIACAPGCAGWNSQAGAPPRAQALRPAATSGATLPPEYVAGLAAAGQRSTNNAAPGPRSSIPGPPPAGIEHRAGSVISPAQSAASAPAGVDPKAFNEVIAQLESIGAIDPAKQARLMEDLKQTDPSLWPLMLDAFRASLAYHERISAKPAGGAAPAVADAGLLAKNVNDSRGGSAQGQLSPESVPPPADLGPWSALNVPSAAVAKSPTENAPLARPSTARDVGSSLGTKLAADLKSNPDVRAVAASKQTIETTSPLLGATSHLTGQSSGNHSPTIEPGKFPIADSRQAAATPQGLPAAAQQAGGVTTTSGVVQSSGAASPSNTIDAAGGVTQPPLPAVQQASYQSKLADDDFEGHLTAAIRALEAKTQKPPDGPDDVAAHAYLRMLYLAAGRREDALRPIAGINPAEQGYWANQLWSLSTYMDSERSADGARRAAEAAQHLNEAAGKLAELATLVVKNPAFCTEVRSYGVFTRFKDYEFTPGQRVLLYAEVENFKSDHTHKGYHTALKSSYQILDAQGRRVAGDDSSVMEEYCQNPRRDYFLSYEHLHLPSPMYAGRYTLQLTIEDTLSQKIGQSSIEFTVPSK